MFKSKHLWIQFFLTIVMFVSGWYFYDCLPEVLTTHRNIHGVADGFQDKNLLTIFLIPLIAFLVLLGMKLTPYIDPRKEKYQQFQGTYDVIQTATLAIFTYFYAAIILLNLDPSWNSTSVALFGIWMMLVVIGNYLPKIKQNYFVGIKTPWTIHDEENWNKTHRMWGICYVLLGISLIINSYFIYFPVGHLILMFVVVLYPILYSYWISIQKMVLK